MPSDEATRQPSLTKRFTALSRVGAALLQERDEARLLQLIAQTACELTGASFAAFSLRPVSETGESLVPSEGGLFHLAAVVGVTGEGDTAALVVHQDVSALKEAERVKDEFIGIAAHELRTPLAVLKGFAQTLIVSCRQTWWPIWIPRVWNRSSRTCSPMPSNTVPRAEQFISGRQTRLEDRCKLEGEAGR